MLLLILNTVMLKVITHFKAIGKELQQLLNKIISLDLFFVITSGEKTALKKRKHPLNGK